MQVLNAASNRGLTQCFDYCELLYKEYFENNRFDKSDGERRLDEFALGELHRKRVGGEGHR